MYAVIDDDTDQKPLDVVGLDGGRVYTLSDGRHSAVVSDISNGRIRPERRRVAAHHGVLKGLLATQSVLPMSFGMIADSPDAVRRILKLNRAAFAAQLRRVRGKVEMGTRVFWDKSNIYEYFVTKQRRAENLSRSPLPRWPRAVTGRKDRLGAALQQRLERDSGLRRPRR